MNQSHQLPLAKMGLVFIDMKAVVYQWHPRGYVFEESFKIVLFLTTGDRALTRDESTISLTSSVLRVSL